MSDTFDPFSKLGQTQKQESNPPSPSIDQRLYTSKKKENAETPKRQKDINLKDQNEITIKRRNAETPNKRLTKRQGMDFYIDQLEKLYDLQIKIRKQTGKKPTLPELVSEALDDLFKKKSI